MRRSPQEIGVTRSWTRRHGVNEFPQAGGVDKQGRPGDVSEYDFRHLENVRWEDPRLVARGGQTALLAPGSEMDGCIMGLAEVSESLALYVGSESDDNTDGEQRLDRYYADGTPHCLSPAIAPGESLPQLVQVWGDTTKPRRNILTFADKLLSYSADDGKVYHVNIPSRGTPIDEIAANTINVQLFELAEMSSWVYKYERDTNADHSSFGELIPVLYMGTVTTGEVYRWDGSNLTLDTPAPLGGTGRIILAVWLGDIVACRTQYVVARNFGPWDRIITLDAAITNFKPSCGREYAASVFFGGEDPAGPATIIYYDAGSASMLLNVIAAPSFGRVVQDMDVFQDKLFFCWTETGNPSNYGWIGTVDATFTFTDNVYQLVAELNGWFGAMLSTGDDLWITVNSTGTTGLDVSGIALRSFTNGGDNSGVSSPFEIVLYSYAVGGSLKRVPADLAAF